MKNKLQRLVSKPTCEALEPRTVPGLADVAGPSGGLCGLCLCWSPLPLDIFNLLFLLYNFVLLLELPLP